MTQPHWSTILSGMMISPQDLSSKCQLNLETMTEANKAFPLRVPQRWLSKIPPGDSTHPLLKQILPSSTELLSTPGYTEDALQESNVNHATGLLHKYHRRVLLLASPACAIHCRYCFRRHFPYHENQPKQSDWDSTLNYIRENKSIHEVILSGGDPLMLKQTQLNALVEQIDAIPHVHTLRFHSRMPVVLPERIDDAFLQLMQSIRCKIVMVIHSNHPLELDDDVKGALTQLRDYKVHLLNQSVILKGVNDNQEALLSLSQRLWACHTLPYYLHMPDKVAGTAHFDVSLEKATQLVQFLSEHLPGYLVPKLVQEVPGALAKQNVNLSE